MVGGWHVQGDALDGVPNTFNHTVKKISLSGAGRYYLALQLKPNVHEGDVQCSVALFPGTICAPPTPSAPACRGTNLFLACRRLPPTGAGCVGF